MPTLVMYTNRGRRVLTYVNKAVEEWMGLPRECVGKMADIITPQAYAALAEHMSAALRGEVGSITHGTTRQGRTREWQTHFVPELAPDGPSGAKGESARLLLDFYDLTELKRLESRLLQARRWGRPSASSPAALRTISTICWAWCWAICSCSSAPSSITQGWPARSNTAMRAAVRQADLTRRLLTFARRRILDPNVVDLNRASSGGLAI